MQGEVQNHSNWYLRYSACSAGNLNCSLKRELVEVISFPSLRGSTAKIKFNYNDIA